MLRRLVSLAAVVSALGTSAMAHASEFAPLSYVDLVRQPATAKRNPQFLAYLLGVGEAIQIEYICNEADRATLSSPSAMIDALVSFSNTAWGRFYLEGTAGIGGIHYDLRSGEALIKIFTEHSRCQPYSRQKNQLER